jgi:hypothetical protein
MVRREYARKRGLFGPQYKRGIMFSRERGAYGSCKQFGYKRSRPGCYNYTTGYRSKNSCQSMKTIKKRAKERHIRVTKMRNGRRVSKTKCELLSQLYGKNLVPGGKRSSVLD